MSDKPLFTRLKRSLNTGVLIGLLGMAFYVSPLGSDLEESIGLHWLFNWRGPRVPPRDVIVVSIDEESSLHLGLPLEPSAWPRRWYAELVERLNSAGAQFIAFDLFFLGARGADDDQVFANALAKSPVGIVDFYSTHVIDPAGSTNQGAIALETRPIQLLAQAAKQVAPFLIPKRPARVARYLTSVSTPRGIYPTLPILGFQHFAHPAQKALVETLASAGLSTPNELLTSATYREQYHYLATAIRDSSLIYYSAIREANKLSSPNTRRYVSSLIRAYANDTLYLDFYGPPGQIKTLPFDQALRPENAGLFKGAFVCIGLSEKMQLQKKGDTFETVFSQANGVDLSGVEIMATTVANLIEDRSLRMPMPLHLLAGLFLWGLVLGILAQATSFRSSAALGTLSLVGYWVAAARMFATESIWLPIVTPILVQFPIALLVGHGFRYLNVRRIFGLFVPKRGIIEAEQGEPAKIAYGTCLSSDIEGYTTIVESMSVGNVRQMLDDYHKAIFPLVEQHGGFISDILGDALMAIWHVRKVDHTTGLAACKAVLDIQAALDQLNRSGQYPGLKTRIGIHTGEFYFGIIGTSPHLEYRATGDVVNTASRIEGVNKVLGTTVLASMTTVAQLGDRVVTRFVGEFLMAGKTVPLGLFELVGHPAEMSEEKGKTLVLFESALAARREREWDSARDLFERVLIDRPCDGPSRFFWSASIKIRKRRKGTWPGMGLSS